MIIGSHDSWTFLRPKRWWMRLFAFTARCQQLNIYDQYAAGARCFDLRVKFTNGVLKIAHGLIDYEVSETEVMGDLYYLNMHPDTYVRVIHEIRSYTDCSINEVRMFASWCAKIKDWFPNIYFFGGNNLLSKPNIDYDFKTRNLQIDGKYGSASGSLLYTLWPWLYAKLHNKENIIKGTSKDVLMIDFISDEDK
ncbi:hypothetical protein L6472_05965 [Prevotella sp. E13-17]|uniref:hypothetical protein n=1 Tax=Prevotella sp. E13-17 TaxID=2913616 RepID=UPI001EDB3D8F|nr:hypothetical protein [Prevotella sp. E13-17]UKK52123.1 hypothetical protein L6472_05965 [Prevotella sp. E13-17]